MTEANAGEYTDTNAKANTNTNTNTDLSYESGLAELKQIVEKLENGEVTLDESLKLFERGVFLTHYLQNKLNSVSEKIEKMEASGEITPFDIPTETADN